MSSEIGGIPSFEVEFTKEGKVFKRPQVDAVLNHVLAGETTDLVVASHGWNNNVNDARGLYAELFTNFARFETPDRRYAILGVLWPSKKFGGDAPGGGASASTDLDAAIRAQLEVLGSDLDPGERDKVRELMGMLDAVEDDGDAQRRFFDTLRSTLPAPGPHDEGEGDSVFFEASGDELMRKLGNPFLAAQTSDGDDEGGAAGIFGDIGSAISGGWNRIVGGVSNLASGAKAAVLRGVNYATYYQMKRRAGNVGEKGLNSVLNECRTASAGLRIHLVGHSFGGKLVTSAVDGPANFGATSLTLLQAAFSHNGFAKRFDGQRNGGYRDVVAAEKVAGPIVITHTKNDSAVGNAYPIASRLAGQDAAGLGDASDRYGAIGSNGAQHTPEATAREMLAVDGDYAFQPGKIYNLESSEFIKDHSDVTNETVAYAVHASVTAT